MTTLPAEIKGKFRQKLTNIILFSYALLVGTAVPLAFSRCTADCFSCGSCGLYLGILPVVSAVLARNRLKHLWERFSGFCARRSVSAPKKDRGS